MLSTATRSLDDFQKNARELVKGLRDSGQPEVLTVDGKAELVVLSTAAYQDLLDQADLSDCVSILKERIAAADAGEAGIPSETVLAEIRERLGIEGV